MTIHLCYFFIIRIIKIFYVSTVFYDFTFFHPFYFTFFTHPILHFSPCAFFKKYSVKFLNRVNLIFPHDFEEWVKQFSIMVCSCIDIIHLPASSPIALVELTIKLIHNAVTCCIISESFIHPDHHTTIMIASIVTITPSRNSIIISLSYLKNP